MAWNFLWTLHSVLNLCLPLGDVTSYLVGAFCLGGVLTYNHACLWRRLRKNSKLTILDPFFLKNRRYVQPTMNLSESIYNCSDLHFYRVKFNINFLASKISILCIFTSPIYGPFLSAEILRFGCTVRFWEKSPHKV